MSSVAQNDFVQPDLILLSYVRSGVSLVDFTPWEMLHLSKNLFHPVQPKVACSLDSYADRHIGSWANYIWVQMWHGLICSSVQLLINVLCLVAVEMDLLGSIAYVCELHMCPYQPLRI